ncbi:MAG: hypothetical protein R2942_10440 [Ignavibacteria bacterium]
MQIQLKMMMSEKRALEIIADTDANAGFYDSGNYNGNITFH